MTAKEALWWSLTGPLGGIPATMQENRKRQEKAMAAANKPPASPLVAAPDTLKPGEKINAINTTPYGVLEAPNTARSTLLGGIR